MISFWNGKNCATVIAVAVAATTVNKIELFFWRLNANDVSILILMQNTTYLGMFFSLINNRFIFTRLRSKKEIHAGD